MSAELKLQKLDTWFDDVKKPLIIAGPCSAETKEQLFETCKDIYEKTDVRVMRAGVWKPRTRPGTFEGTGVEALKWIAELKKEIPVKFAVEVANPLHVEAALKYGIDILWIGARSTVNPFTVQEIADTLKGVDVPVLVKNPINPDFALWLGALERLNKCGVEKLGAIHRGYSSFQKTKYRNVPMWKFPIELKEIYPDMPIIGDPSHIGGTRDLILPISQQSLDLNYDGLMIETHRDPDNAWSDAKQQVTPPVLADIIKELQTKNPTVADTDFNTFMDDMRDEIDNVDRELLELLARRTAIVEKIGEFKKQKDVTVLQENRWREIHKTRAEWGKSLKLDEAFVDELVKLIHVSSINRQEEIIANK